MVLEHRSKIHVRQDVAVDYQERLLAVAEKTQGTGGAERLVLVHVIDSDTEFISVTEVLRYGFRLIVCRQIYTTDAGFLKLLDCPFQHWTVPEEKHRLRGILCKRTHSHAEAASHNHRSQRQFILTGEVAQKCHVPYTAFLIEDRNLPNVHFVHQVQ